MKIKLFILFILSLPDQFFNLFNLHFKRVKWGKNLTINGKLIIKNKGIISIGDDCKINSGKTKIPIGGDIFARLISLKGSSLIIGNNVGISNSTLFCANRIVIEDNVLIGGSCRIWDTNFHSLDSEIRGGVNDSGKNIKTSPVFIKESAFIGGGTIVLKGVTIGKKSIVAAGSVVTRNIPDNELWGGNPAKYIRNI